MIINIQHIFKAFGKTKVLNDISINLFKGEIIALIGPNGSGKTTLLKSILGLILPDSGSILVQGKAIKTDYSYRNIIGYMPQIAKYPENLKVKELIHLVRNLRGNPEGTDEELMNSLQISDLSEKALGSLSGGQKQKVGAYIAFLFNPEIIILDEPTAGLDPVSTEIIKEKIIKSKKEGKLIVITTHIMQDADELSDRLIYLMEGKIFIDMKIEQLKEQTRENTLNKALAKKISEYEKQ